MNDDELAERAVRNHPPTKLIDIPELVEDPSPDPFDDDEPLACGIEDPEHCESCQ